MTVNPWCEIPGRGRYVLEDDKPYLDAFNEICTDEKKRINFDHPPEPRLGPVDAPVVFLQANPSYGADESDGPRDPEDLKESIRTLSDEHCPHKGALAPGGWWAPRLRELRKDVGKEDLSTNLLSVEFFPYRSRRFGHGEIRLPSQWYTFSLVRKARQRGAIIIVTRKWALWVSAIPELRSGLGNTVFRTNSAQSSHYSRNNMGNAAYEAVIHAISRT